MTRKIAMVNQKGGVGKTTTAHNLAACFARGIGLPECQRVLVVDLDPHANMTTALLGAHAAAESDQATIYEVLIGERQAEEAIRTVELKTHGQAPSANLDLLPSHLNLAGAEIELLSEIARESRLRDALATVADRYDYILVDCPPTLSLLTLNGLVGASEVIIPVEPGYFAAAGLGQLLKTLDKVRRVNADLVMLGVVPTLTTSTNLARQITQSLHEKFGAQVLPAIPRRASIGEATAANTDIFGYVPISHDAAQAFVALAQEVHHGTR